MNSSIARAAIVISLGNVVSRLLGVVREQVIAGLFGATYATDAFTAASRVPVAIYDLLVGGMISAALVPVFSGYFNSEDRRSLGILAGTIIAMVSGTMVVVVGMLILFAPQLMEVFAQGYTTDTKLLSIRLVRLILPCLFFLGVSAVCTALLYAEKRFTLPATSAAIYNVGILSAAVLLHRLLGVTSLVIGVLFGTFLQMAVQMPALFPLARYMRINPWYPGVKNILALYWPVAVGLVVSASSIAIDTNLASRTGEGNLAAMRFATTIVQLPLGLVATAVSFAVLPTLSSQAPAQPSTSSMDFPLEPASPPRDKERAPHKDGPATSSQGNGQQMDEFRNTLTFGLKVVLLLILPATVGLAVLRYPLIRLLFERGAFDRLATDRTALAFLAYSPGLPAAAVDQVLVYSFYAMKKTITPVIVGLVGVGVYLVVGISLLEPMGMPGLALANSAQWVTHALIMMVLLVNQVGGLGPYGLVGTIFRASLASLIMGLVLGLLLTAGEGLADGSVFALATLLAVIVACGAGVYVLALATMKGEEVGIMKGVLARRWRGVNGS